MGSIAVSGNGTKLAGCNGAYDSGCIYMSNDFGNSWSKVDSAESTNYSCVALSSDGMKVAASVGGGDWDYDMGYIHTSVNGGADWIIQYGSGKKFWREIASSADGTILAAISYGDSWGTLNPDYVYYSTDSGTTWTAFTELGTAYWYSISMSADGRKIAVIDDDYKIYTMSGSGDAWSVNDSGFSGYVVALSPDGATMAAGAEDKYLYIYSDLSGEWVQQTSAGCRKWHSIALSYDGTKIVACETSGFIWTGTLTTTPNEIPVLTAIGSQTAAEGGKLEFLVSATDADGDKLTLTADGLPATGLTEPAKFTDNGDGTGTFAWTPNYTAATSSPYKVTFTVSDGEDSVSEAVSITVTNANAVPSVGTSTSGTIKTNEEKLITTTCSDPDGYADMKHVKALINKSKTMTNACYLYYYNSKLYIRDDTNTSWLGGYAPGTDITVENSQIKLNCKASKVTGSGSDLSITWAVTFKDTYTGTMNVYLNVEDTAKAGTGWVTSTGTYTISSNSAPITGTVTPSSGTAKVDEETLITTTYSDANGYADMKYVKALINKSKAMTNACYLYYYDSKLYIRNDANTSWQGGYTPGTDITVENSQVKLNCAKSTVTGSGNDLSITWAVTFKDTYTGSKKVYLSVEDKSKAGTGWVDTGAIVTVEA
jgi:hypothetical protein